MEPHNKNWRRRHLNRKIVKGALRYSYRKQILTGYTENHGNSVYERRKRAMKEVWMVIIAALLDLDKGYKHLSAMLNSAPLYIYKKVFPISIWSQRLHREVELTPGTSR